MPPICCHSHSFQLTGSAPYRLVERSRRSRRSASRRLDLAAAPSSIGASHARRVGSRNSPVGCSRLSPLLLPGSRIRSRTSRRGAMHLRLVRLGVLLQCPQMRLRDRPLRTGRLSPRPLLLSNSSSPQNGQRGEQVERAVAVFTVRVGGGFVSCPARVRC